MNTQKTLLATGLMAIAIAQPTAWAGPKDVPFKASLAAQEVLALYPADGPCAGFFAQGTTAVIGKASHLGRVAGVGSDCIKLTHIGPPPSFAFENGELTVTAANGDRLTLSYSGTFIPTAQPPIYAISGLFQITGGTGRFAHATGSGFLEGTENISTFQGQLELSGKISY
ncbi:MAG: hypothetical protein AW08_02503 [Candidatus Accumulibacter adjunctus]|uniref:DUF3224 domain-containing protein n=1 Tax=Candidatus Accumulibacter adjunctus TaxID=1454001 RepID=A0A011MA48_9PROT|nr:MAG: hypothetical protein AW08_02503 [Candidatus Accumulibacter adjunctus]